MDVKLYRSPNPALAANLRGAEMRSAVRQVAEIGEALYREEVAKRTGRIAAATHVSTEIGGVDSDRWIGVLTVGGAGADYALAHEFGADERYDANRGDPAFDETQGAQDLNRVLEIIDAGGGLW